jgi:hypothetical protein
LVIQAHNNYDNNGNIIYDPSLYMYSRLSGGEDKLDIIDSSAISYRILHVYPNPFADFLDVTISSLHNDQLVFTLRGVNGVLADRQTKTVHEGMNSIRYEPKEPLLSGFYLLTIRSTQTGKAVNVKLIRK